MAEDEMAVIMFIPALAAVLLRAEEMKGSPLTEDDVLRIRDEAICMTVTAEQARALEEERGYEDIDPADCWAEWQKLREELGTP